MNGAVLVVVLGLVVSACGDGDVSRVTAGVTTTDVPAAVAPSLAVPSPDDTSEARPSTTSSSIRTTDLTPRPVGAKAEPTTRSRPVRVQVPTVGIDAPLVELVLAPDGAVEAPADFDSAGWYTGSAEPGQLGPAVVAGHIDSRSGPAAFFRLAEVRIGDRIDLHREDGTVISFVVTALEQHAKDGLAAEIIHGPVTGPELRLVTCGGDFDRSTGHYRDNVLVFAALA